MENGGGNLEAKIEMLLNVEKQMRQAGNVGATRKAVTDTLQLCFDTCGWKTLNKQIVLISKHHGQLKQVPDVFVLLSVLGDTIDEVPFDEYCTWAGDMELQAASLVIHSNICIHRARPLLSNDLKIEEFKELAYSNGC